MLPTGALRRLSGGRCGAERCGAVSQAVVGAKLSEIEICKAVGVDEDVVRRTHGVILVHLLWGHPCSHSVKEEVVVKDAIPCLPLCSTSHHRKGSTQHFDPCTHRMALRLTRSRRRLPEVSGARLVSFAGNALQCSAARVQHMTQSAADPGGLTRVSAMGCRWPGSRSTSQWVNPCK